MYIDPIWVGLILGMAISLIAMIALGYFVNRRKR